jgi:hypothetical protein
MNSGQVPTHQKIATGIVLVLGGFLLVGTLLDAVGNAVALIVPAVTYAGTVLLLVLLLGLNWWLKRRPMEWIARGNHRVRIRRLGRGPVLGVVGAVALLWVPRILEWNRPGDRGARREPGTDSLARYDRGRGEEGAYFRMWPVPMIDGMIDGKAGRDGRYSMNAKEYQQGLHLAPGDEVLVSVFFLNGGDGNSSTAHNARMVSRFSMASLTEHEVSAALAIDNGMIVYSRQTGMGGVLKLQSSVPTKLVYIPGSTHMCVRSPPLEARKLPVPGDPTGVCAGATENGPIQLVRLPDGIANEAVGLGDLPGAISGLVVFALKVEGDSAAA